ncbi:ATP-binding cassette domain-containing protein [Erysipelothrix rhusiopathiae]|uniref:ABC transporter, ATP-binding protein n=1 Tax=Erysipelothrix rhusiopathiae ATCC 19414 TaxID=525280 RepID=E7FXD7_ERYRH|nr:ATP-binding cassette domain-containing protein [Erysipelothrix rhusiopathiae]EFY08161.1 ABC transporter, ATP-binding protein [Erysipelothrix rhusiopathiae ATCC 19414]MDE8256314.1 ATP-binding cassette domain-containing protein [Erysipelothrix rhusiopathiae]MDE8340500.1 ATP-binding cassette domain-containing protein [Erysipelothrix rhusiopathiae]MDV7680542.1 ATP-binding cassette domain-containing protein [Erysipelothrix rhusiopathiae]RNM29949.1 ATP-binding cassette domain-containing protein [
MLQLNNISKAFNRNTPMETKLYQNVNLQVDEGEFVTIIGSNGSGKSTLLNLVCGQIDPDEGNLIFMGHNLLKMKNHERFKTISRVYQDPMAGTSPSLTVLENLSLASNKGKLMSLKKAINHKKESEFIALLKSLDLGLEDKLHVQVGQLSGGQRQALSLLMALMNNPNLLLLDEHTAALDPKSSESIIKLTQEMVSKRKITTIMVTHNLQHALDYGTRLLMFHNGTIIRDISNDEKSKLTKTDLLNMFASYDDNYVETI